MTAEDLQTKLIAVVTFLTTSIQRLPLKTWISVARLRIIWALATFVFTTGTLIFITGITCFLWIEYGPRIALGVFVVVAYLGYQSYQWGRENRLLSQIPEKIWMPGTRLLRRPEKS